MHIAIGELIKTSECCIGSGLTSLSGTHVCLSGLTHCIICVIRTFYRVAADGTLHEARPRPDIQQQFPLQCKITHNVIGAVSRKVTCCCCCRFCNPQKHINPTERDCCGVAMCWMSMI